MSRVFVPGVFVLEPFSSPTLGVFRHNGNTATNPILKPGFSITLSCKGGWFAGVGCHLLDSTRYSPGGFVLEPFSLPTLGVLDTAARQLQTLFLNIVSV